MEEGGDLAGEAGWAVREGGYAHAEGGSWCRRVCGLVRSVIDAALL